MYGLGTVQCVLEIFIGIYKSVAHLDYDELLLVFVHLLNV
jgi:hypothetical protein